MKHHYTEEEIQAAIDAACSSLTREFYMNSATLNPENSFWPKESNGRLHLLKSALDKLPEPQPPTADGKTPGLFLWEVGDAYIKQHFPWNVSVPYEDVRGLFDSSASAVLAAFGGAGLEQAIARMEVVDEEALAKICAVQGTEGLRARLIAAAREGQPLPIATLAQDQVQATPEMLAAADAVLREEMGQPAVEADPYAELKAAHKAGKVIQMSDEYGRDWKQINDPCFKGPIGRYRIAPAPTYRAWNTVDEVPVGAVAKNKANDFRAIIVGAFGDASGPMVLWGNSTMSAAQMFAERTLTTGEPCGVEVKP